MTMALLDPAHLRPIVTFPRDAIVDYEHLAAAFGVSIDKIKEQNFPCLRFGRNSVRFLWGQVLDEIAQRAQKSL